MKKGLSYENKLYYPKQYLTCLLTKRRDQPSITYLSSLLQKQNHFKQQRQQRNKLQKELIEQEQETVAHQKMANKTYKEIVKQQNEVNKQQSKIKRNDTPKQQIIRENNKNITKQYSNSQTEPIKIMVEKGTARKNICCEKKKQLLSEIVGQYWENRLNKVKIQTERVRNANVGSNKNDNNNHQLLPKKAKKLMSKHFLSFLKAHKNNSSMSTNRDRVQNVVEYEKQDQMIDKNKPIIYFSNRNIHSNEKVKQMFRGRALSIRRGKTSYMRNAYGNLPAMDSFQWSKLQGTNIKL